MLDRSTLGEINNLIEFMDSEDTIEVQTNQEYAKVIKRNGTFYLDQFVQEGRVIHSRTKLSEPPTLTDLGYFIMKPPSLSGREYIQTREVMSISNNGKKIYELKRG